MKAFVIEHFGDVKEAHLKDVPTPQPLENEVQIQIHYTSVNPVDWKIGEGHLKNRIPHEFPLILGWDAAGIVKLVGKNVKNFKPDDEVFAYCRKPLIKWGTYAEYICFDANNIALKPKNISFAEAAAIPLVGLTAWQALFDYAKLKKGESILIHAGAGGVGSLAIEFAKNAGAKVFTTARKENHAYVKKLGADVAIDYTQQNFAEEIKKLNPQGLDVVFDCIGGPTLKESFSLLKPQGRLVSIIEQLDAETAKKKNIQFSYVFVSPNGKELKQIADLIEAGKVIPPHVETMKFEEAPKALQKIKEGHTRGKIVLKIK